MSETYHSTRGAKSRSTGSGSARSRSAGSGSARSRSAGSRSARSRSAGSRTAGHEYALYAGILAAIVVVLNILAWCSHGFCDWYTRYLYPIWLNCYGRFTSLFPFSVGEVLIVIGIILVILAAFSWIPMVVSKKAGLNRIVVSYYRFFLAALLNVALVMTLNCFILYHCTPLEARAGAVPRDYSIDNLYTLREHLVSEINTLSAQMTRDEQGYAAYDGNLQEACEAALLKLGAKYPKLDGWYPTVKRLYFSDLFTQMYISGYFFPFSMEANANDNMVLLNYPETYCHELAHTRGYIYENEANFISYLACIGSDDPFLQYSGYLAVYNYVTNDLFASLSGTDVEYSLSFPEEHVFATDLLFLPAGKWEEIEQDAIISTDVVETVSDTLMDTSLKVNGVASGKASYSEVVALLLQYYDGILY